jgi:hypothetical protein
MKTCYLFRILVVIVVHLIWISIVSATEIESLTENNIKHQYHVTCKNGEQHRIIANHSEQDFQYHYPDKEYYIKFYDMEFETVEDFARWVCRNK